MLQHKELLIEKNNLLAFSAGVDSTALLFLLLEAQIKFDIAIVDYGLREASKKELAYAQELAKKYNFRCHSLKAEEIFSNFEAKARKIRYDFFETLIQKYKYTTLLTAHHLGDRFEWMLMQFCKGAGCLEIAGMNSVQKKENYTIVRPLLHLDKRDLLQYLHTNKRAYFLDDTNDDEKYKRNEFRHKYANPLLEKYRKGIKNSFDYIDKDRLLLLQETQLHIINKLAYFSNTAHSRSAIFMIDKYLKSIGHIMTSKERELLESQVTTIIGRKFIVNQGERYIFIAPYFQAKIMTKIFKEKMRLLRIDPKLRAYLSTDAEAVSLLSLVLQ